MRISSVLRRGAGAVLLAVGVQVSACKDEGLAGPQAELMSSGDPQTSQPFYYYQGQPVYLDTDSSGLVIATQLPDPGAALAEAVSGLEVARLDRVAAEHWVMRFPVSANRSARQAALARLRADARFSFSSPLYRVATDQSTVTLIGTLAVRFRRDVSRAAIDGLLTPLGLRIIRGPVPDSGYFEHVLAYPRDQDPLEIAAIVDRHPLVEWADPNKIADRRLQVTDPYFSSQYYLKNVNVLNGVRVDDNVEAAWNHETGANYIRVVVVDDGIDGQLSDLFCSTSFILAHDAFLNQYPDTPLFPHANDRHGTAVAGIINGCHNSSGIAGIAPGVQLGVVRAFRNGIPATDQNIANGIATAWASVHADVLSNSWGGGAPSNLITTAINDAATQGRSGKGTVVVFAAGNTSARSLSIIGAVNYPANLANVIAVGAINSTGALTDYTPEGPELDIVAPSSHVTGTACGSGDVFTTDRFGAAGCNDGPNGDQLVTSSFGGTSAAAPQVAAAAALLLSENPNLTRQQVTGLLLSNADRNGSWAVTTKFGQGKLNIYNAMAPLLPPPPPPLTVSISGPNPVRPYSACLYQAHPLNGAAPYSYAWTANGVPVGDGTAFYRHYAGTSNFELVVTVTDGGGLIANNTFGVGIDDGAAECLDQ